MKKAPHSWKLIRSLLAANGMRVMAVADTAERLTEAKQELAKVRDDARKVLDQAEGDTLSEDDESKLLALIGEKGDGGRAGELSDEIAKLETLADQRRALALTAGRPLETDGRINRGPDASDRYDSQIKDAATGKPVAMSTGGKPLFTGGDEGSAPHFGEGVVAMFKGEASPDGAVFEGGDSGGNFFVNPASTGILLDKLLARDVMTAAGVRSFAMTAPEMRVTEVLDNPVGAFRPELGTIQASRPSFGLKHLRAKSAACAIVLSEELIADSANAASAVQEAAVAAMSDLRARAILRGAGSEHEPQGVLSNPNIHSVAGGYPDDYRHLAQAVGRVLQSDFPGAPSELGVIHHPRDAEVLDGLVASDGQPLQPSQWVADLSRYTTTALRTDLGAANDEGEALLGHFPSVLVGMRQQLQARMVDAGTMQSMNGETYEAPAQLVKYLILTMRFDVLVLRPRFFASINGLLAVDPAI